MEHQHTSTTPRLRSAMAVLAAGVLLLAACGDDDDDATATTAAVPATTAEAPAATEAAPATTEAGPATTAAPTATTEGSTAGTTAAPEAADPVAAAQQVVDEFSVRPTTDSLMPLDPVGAEIPTGKTIDFISCGTPDCNEQADIAKHAAEILGWTVQTIGTDGTPQQVQNAWVQVLREKPDGVMVAGFPRSLFDQELRDAEEAGIAVVMTGSTDVAGDGITWHDGTNFYTNAGELMASWVIANSDGAPNAVFANIPNYPILDTVQESFKQSLMEQAPDAKVDTLTIPLEALGTTAPDLFVSYVRSHPDLEFLIPSFDVLYTGVPAALDAAGISGLKKITITTSATGLQDIATGNMDAAIGFDAALKNYYLIDALARHFAGVELGPTVQYPKFIMNKDNLPPIQNNYPIVEGLDEYFSQLWGKA
jgi:hypothetical protein